MALLTRAQLEALWITNYKPPETSYDDVWESHFNISEDELILGVALSQLDTDLEANTGIAKFPCPEDMTIKSVFVQVTTAPTGSTAQWDINVEGATILSPKITIDAGEFSSLTAATPPVISSADVDKGEDFTIDRDQVGATIPGQNDILMIRYIKR